MLLSRLLLAIMSSTILASTLPSQFNVPDSADTIDTDVIIVGGGASGTHAAISLKDAGYRTLVLEKEGRLGGHTESYLDPETKVSWDWGVLIYHNEDVVKQFFARLNVTIKPIAFALDRIAADMKTGKDVNATLYTPAQVQTALQTYAGVIAQWPDLEKGMYLPDPVPEDLVLSFGAFVKKFNCEAVVPLATQFIVGVGELLDTPVVEVIRLFGLSTLKQFQTGFLQTPDGNNSALYVAAEKDLKASNSLILNAQVTGVQRTKDNGVKVVVETVEGCKIVVAKKLVVAIPPKLDVVGNFDLDAQETNLFSKFLNTGYYTTLLRNAGLPWNLTIYNADMNRPYAFPDLPSVSTVGHAGIPRIHGAFYQTGQSKATHPLPDDEVKAEIIATIKRLQAGSNGKYNNTEPEFIACKSHAPFYLQVEAQEIKNGFYKDLYALQGERNTFWTGAAWKGQDSSGLWKFNQDVVLPALIQSLKK